MKIKGLKTACHETKYCEKIGGVCEIAINKKTMELHANWYSDANSFSQWHNKDIVNLIYTTVPMSMAEIKTAVEENLPYYL